MLTDAQAPLLGTPLVPSRLTVYGLADYAPARTQRRALPMPYGRLPRKGFSDQSHKDTCGLQAQNH